MGAAGLRFSVACVILMVSIHTIYKENIHAHAVHENHTALSSILCPAPSPSLCQAKLRVGVPWKRYFTEFVSAGKNGTNPTGFCVKAFEKAIEPLNCTVEYITFGNGTVAPPNYDELVQRIADKEIDAVVGDMMITENRSQKVVFTQPFLDSSLVAVVRLRHESLIRSPLIFMKPFSNQLWLLIVVFFVCGVLAVYLLERRKNPPVQGRRDSSRFGAVLMYTFSTWFLNPEDTRSVMGRTVVVACLVVTGILYSCYTASLSAILTAPRLEPTINDIQSVLARQDIKIGYWNGSSVGDFLTNELKISEKRLIYITEEADFYNHLSKGLVDAIIDERPYMQSVVAKHCSELAFAGPPFINLNWGFAFHPSLNQLATNISSRLMHLTESAELYTIQRESLPQYESYCRNQSMSDSNQLQVQQFWGLFAISASVTVIVLMVNIVLRRCRTSRGTDSGTPRGTARRPSRRTFSFLRRTSSFQERRIIELRRQAGRRG